MPKILVRCSPDNARELKNSGKTKKKKRESPMRVQFFTAALVIAAAGLAGMAALSAQAASNLNSSKSNIYRPITSAAGEVACARAGGTVVLQNRTKVCSISPVATDTNRKTRR